MEDKIGKTYEVLLEDLSDDLEYFVGRSYMDVPESDGVIYVKYDKNYGLNEFVNVEITNWLDDLSIITQADIVIIDSYLAEMDLYNKILLKNSLIKITIIQ